MTPGRQLREPLGASREYSRHALPASKIAETATRQIAELTGKKPLGATSVRPTDDGWRVEVEVVEIASARESCPRPWLVTRFERFAGARTGADAASDELATKSRISLPPKRRQRRPGNEPTRRGTQRQLDRLRQRTEVSVDGRLPISRASSN